MMQLNEEYNREQFLDFLNKSFLTDFQKDIRPVSSEGFKAINKAYTLGTSSSLDLQVFEFEYSGSFNKRITLTKEAFQVMKQSATFRALAVFRSSENNDWRFSLMTASPKRNSKGNIIVTYSNPRRFSFFLGPNAKINTPNRFLINGGQVKDFDDLLSRFNVEIVTKEFFENYKKLFDRLISYLNKDQSFQAFAGRNGVETSNFAKKLLGQIVFLYFLQRKGWLGAKKGDSISHGDKNFLRSLFNKNVENKTNFYNTYLEPLFYGALNKPPEKAGSYYRDYFNCQIPFLNGGLFEPPLNYDWENEFLSLPDKLFSKDPNNPSHGNGILDIFDLYNFTVDESDFLDKEVSVDPEMLGKVFENLLEENLRKGKGTYYTPREIVNYMCEESLVNYLATETGRTADDIKHNYFPAYNVLGDENIEVRDVSVGEQIIESLKNIKVVDPACGSGAFLVGMLQQITHLRYELESKSKQDGRRDVTTSEYEIKKQTIQDCIYGVDLDPGAVEIAKLRLWLSLVVDYDLEEIEPLPNLDYKIMQGNSLLEELVLGDSTIKLYDQLSIKKAINSKRMLNLFEENKQMAMFDDIKKEQALKNMKALQIKYFSQSDAGEKKKIKTQIEKIEHDLIEVSVKAETDKLSAQRINIKAVPGVGLLPNDAKRLEKILSKEQQIMAVLDELRKTGTKPFFLWHLNFADVFEQKGGFDVVIANPPYGAEIDKKQLLVMKDNLIDTKNSNSAAIFIDFGKNTLLNKNGTLSYIVPKSLLFSEAWFDLVEAMLGKVNILVDVEKAFENVLLEQVLFLYGNSTKTSSYYARKFLNNDFIRSVNIANEMVYKFNAWICDATESELRIACRILNNSSVELLGLISETKRGVGLQKYIKQKGEMPVIGGKNIFKYGVRGNKGYLSKEDIKLNSSKISFMKQKKIISQNIVAHVQNPVPHLVIIATIDQDGTILCLDTVNNTVVNSDYDPKYILAIMNSSLISWYAYRFIYCAAIRTMHFDSNYVGKLPILKANKEVQQNISQIVDKMLIETKSENYNDDSSKIEKVKNYEKQINEIVYELYNLSEEDIKVVEGNND